MATKIVTANGVYDLSNVKSLKDLKEEIQFLKTSLKNDEQQLESSLRKMPKQLVKSATDNLVPPFLNKLIANGTWKLLLSSAAMFANPFSGKFSFKKNIVGSAKKLGMIALLKGVVSALSKKHMAKQTAVTDIKRATVTSLKTKNFKKN
jgi:hypothetical protein